MKTKIMQFLREEDGITTLEYGVLAALVAVVILAVIGKDTSSGLGKILSELLNKVESGAGLSSS